MIIVIIKMETGERVEWTDPDGIVRLCTILSVNKNDSTDKNLSRQITRLPKYP